MRELAKSQPSPVWKSLLLMTPATKTGPFIEFGATIYVPSGLHLKVSKPISRIPPHEKVRVMVKLTQVWFRCSSERLRKRLRYSSPVPNHSFSKSSSCCRPIESRGIDRRDRKRLLSRNLDVLESYERVLRLREICK